MERLMKYLLDTNIIIEGLLGGKKGEDVKNLFKKVDIFLMAITDLSLHSIGIILFRFKKKDLFFSFIKDTIYNGMAVLSSEIENFKKLYFFSEKFNIDFEDAYQYAIADKYNLTIISFDKDFDRTERKRIQPVDILK
jgi:predicted nucleic acid-binding protein